MDDEHHFFFYPQTHGQLERTIQVLEDVLRACVLNINGSWVLSTDKKDLRFSAMGTCFSLSPY